MNRFHSFSFVVVVAAFSSCLSVDSGRERAAQQTCQWESRCGNVGSGQTYANNDECLTKWRSNYLSSWPTDRCDGKMNPEAFDVCVRAIDNTRCNDFLDAINTASKCSSGSVCTANSGNTGCNCGQGETCCNNACVNLTNDRNNCGACGTSCGNSVSCQSGQCR